MKFLAVVALLFAYQNCSPSFQVASHDSLLSQQLQNQAGTPPSSTLASTYTWVPSSWSACPVTCGGGLQTRTVICQNGIGETVLDALCGAEKPGLSQACGTSPCSSGATCQSGFHMENGACVGDTRACTIANGTGSQTWNGSAWGDCQAVSCATNYQLQNGACVLAASGFMPQNRAVSDLYPGALEQVFVPSQVAGQTGQWWCENQFNRNVGGSWSCTEVSSGGTCTSDVPAKSLVTCIQRKSVANVTATTGPVAGQTGQWWCSQHFAANWQCYGVDGSSSACAANVAAGQTISCAEMYQADSVTADRAGSGQNGDWWCDAHFGANLGGKWKCLDQTGVSATGLASCAVDSAVGSVVRCERVYFGSASAATLRPDPTCTRSDLDSNEVVFCKYTNYTRDRDVDSLVLMNRHVRLGLNRRLGGTIFELYGPDFQNRIEEHGGSAMQLSLWGYDANASGAAYFRNQVCDPTPYPPNSDGAAACKAANNGVDCRFFTATGWQISDCVNSKPCSDWSAAAPINPIQAQSQNCGWSDSSGAVAYDPITVPNQRSPGITLAKQNPYNFTKTNAVQGMTWGSNSVLLSNAPFAAIEYSVNYQGQSLGFHNQEMPAIFLDLALGSTVFFYEGPNAYHDVAGAVTKTNDTDTDSLGLPGRTGDQPASLTPRPMTEEWASFCDAAGVQCVTLATFNPLAKQFVTQGQYVTVLGRFALTQGFSAAWRVYIFPYRFDDVIEGKTVRQWIYDLKASGG